MTKARTPTERLPTLCDIQSGFTVRGKLGAAEEGPRVITLRDTSDGAVEFDALGRAPLEEAGERYVAQEGDLIFRTRFEPNIAIHLGSFPGKAIVVSPLLRLRVTEPSVEPAYLAWAINQRPAQTHINRQARGTSLRMIPRSALDDLEIPIPPIAVQRAIVEVAQLAEAERALTRRLADKRQELIGFALQERARKTQPHGGATGP
jgi:hypothetical protein